ncbi:methyltransferase domain containing protein [Plakobranchus ocellatus]|uniref:Methyltransferase domain containing protein n=1 Tax=Plakobranchus ocellatus TaxID=259542 RepID=A0AAV3YLM3_9GAST|nr:methyltransferase domain containing protein [Plakobranchus ocellatus]
MSSAEQIAMAREMMSSTVDKTKMYVDMEQSKAYADFRPRYSEELFQTIVDYCKETSPSLDLAVDIGCGPGMSTLGFAKHFKKIVGVDVSETQIACAPKNIPNVEWRVGYSDKLPFIKSGTVDLVCSGESFNLMPQKETFAEADRVLKPGGTIAIFGYDMPTSDDPEMAALMQKMFMTMIPYWPKESTQLFDKFQSVEIPYPGWIRNDSLKMKMTITVDQYMGMMKSTWPVVAYSKEHPNEDFVGDIAKQITEILKKQGKGPEYTINYNLFIIMGHKPKK